MRCFYFSSHYKLPFDACAYMFDMCTNKVYLLTLLTYFITASLYCRGSRWLFVAACWTCCESWAMQHHDMHCRFRCCHRHVCLQLHDWCEGTMDRLWCQQDQENDISSWNLCQYTTCHSYQTAIFFTLLQGVTQCQHLVALENPLHGKHGWAIAKLMHHLVP